MNPQNTSFLNNSRDSSRRSSISVISNRFDSVITGELKSLNIEAEKLKNVTKEIIVIRRVQMKFCVFALALCLSTLAIYVTFKMNAFLAIIISLMAILFIIKEQIDSFIDWF
ncbi:unnamed protein product [Rotaria magnacalcarata]|uniref:Uncharacterized protein n=1 Tax=Rotaria magnacalcarata TaxID=392030 RepID=A0A816WAR9_9BILA|nr:unnamed protein product [Rotaria magnacalcarata]